MNEKLKNAFAEFAASATPEKVALAFPVGIGAPALTLPEVMRGLLAEILVHHLHDEGEAPPYMGRVHDLFHALTPFDFRLAYSPHLTPEERAQYGWPTPPSPTAESQPAEPEASQNPPGKPGRTP